jgi:hypothetical protein
LNGARAIERSARLRHTMRLKGGARKRAARQKWTERAERARQERELQRASRTAEPGGAEPGGAEPGGAEPGGAEPGGAEVATPAPRNPESPKLAAEGRRPSRGHFDEIHNSWGFGSRFEKCSGGAALQRVLDATGSDARRTLFMSATPMTEDAGVEALLDLLAPGDPCRAGAWSD